MRALLLFVIGLIFGTTGGFLAGGGLTDAGLGHDHAGHSDAGHDHADLVAWGRDLPLPDLDLALIPDSVAGQNLQMTLSGFIFTPTTVGGTDTPGEGHAHVYLNGQKVGRAYGTWMHLPAAQTGDVIRVTLNGDSHAGWIGPNGPLAADITVP